MGSIFDIFKATPDGPLWVEAVQGLTQAEERMAHLALTSPGEYFIHSQEKVLWPDRLKRACAVPTQIKSKQRTVAEILEESHDSNLHDEMPTLRKHSIQGEARRAIQG